MTQTVKNDFDVALDNLLDKHRGAFAEVINNFTQDIDAFSTQLAGSELSTADKQEIASRAANEVDKFVAAIEAAQAVDPKAPAID